VGDEGLGPLADQVDEGFSQRQDAHGRTVAIVAAMPTAQLGEQLVHWREADGAPVLYVHGVPNASSMWEPFLAVTGGVAVDLPGFGQSGKRGDLDTSFRALGRFVGEFADHLGLEQVRLCMHDWGAVGLLWAMAEPARVERLVLLDAVPFLPGYRWHYLARQWRRRGIGEIAMGSTNRLTAGRLLPAELVDEVFEAFDVGTQRSILRLYRSAPEQELAAAGEWLEHLGCPALVVWGGRDPYIDPAFAAAYAEALGGPAETHVAPGAGHWPWCDEPAIVRMVTDFLVR
jgi:pimeloyl-ACP methyl ester carboxylesterase